MTDKGERIMTTSGTTNSASIDRSSMKQTGAALYVTLTEPIIAPRGRHLLPGDELQINPTAEPTPESLVLLDGYVAPYTGQSGVIGVVRGFSSAVI